MKTPETYRIIERNKPDNFARMDPAMKRALEHDIAGTRAIRDRVPEAAANERLLYRLARRQWNENPPPVFGKQDFVLEGPHGRLRVRLYRADGIENNPCILFFHGGGFMVGDVDTHDGIASRLCAYSGANVVSVEYQLAPEYTHPVQLEESVFVTDYVRENAGLFHIDPQRLAYAGDSAGAFLSLCTYLHLRDMGRDVSFVKTLLLYYGTVGLADSASRRLYGGDWDGMTFYDLDRYEDVFFGGDKSVGALIDRDFTEPMPATYILACGLDPLLDDSRVLYEILCAKGHTAELSVKEGYVHGFLHYSGMLPGAEEAIKESAEFFKRRIGKAGA